MDLRNLPHVPNSHPFMDLKDVIRESALPFLPAKSIMRFRAVCQDWRHKISFPFFHHYQSIFCRSISALFCQTSENPPVFIPIDLPKSCGVPDPSLSFLPEPVVIRSSSHGVLCCQGRNGDRPYYLCNPVTQQWKILPQPTANHGDDPKLVLIFEPSLLNFKPQYNLICAFHCADFDETGFEIYSSKNNAWNVSGEFCFGVERDKLRSGIHINSVVYWPVKSGGILSFDLKKDRSIYLESFMDYNDCILGTFGGRLCKVFIFDNAMHVKVLINIHTNTMSYDDIAMDDDYPYDMWTKRPVLDSDDTDMPLDDLTKVVAVTRYTVVVKRRNRFYSYDFQRQRSKRLRSPPAESPYVICLPYVNSLVSF
nr:F-box protein At5g03970-like [Ipomoea trifida]